MLNQEIMVGTLQDAVHTMIAGPASHSGKRRTVEFTSIVTQAWGMAVAKLVLRKFQDTFYEKDFRGKYLPEQFG